MDNRTNLNSNYWIEMSMLYMKGVTVGIQIVAR
jgi:hypothetical protein